jgi:hypothetical protein
MTKNKKILYGYIFPLLVFVGIIVLLQRYIQDSYIKTIQTPRFIEDFQKATEEDLLLLKTKYKIEYAVIRSGKIVIKPNNISLPRLDLLTITFVKNPLVISGSYEDKLSHLQPYVFTSSFSMYILFPLVFPDKEYQLLIIKKILP